MLATSRPKRLFGAGEKQAYQYIDALTARFAWLAKNPTLGRSRDDIVCVYQCFRQGSHIVFYVQKDDGLYIIGVPHASMDIDAYFRQDKD